MQGIERHKNLQGLNTLAVPSEAAAFFQLQAPGFTAAILDWSHAQGLPVVVLGEGSNVLLAEQLEMLVLMQACKGIEVIAESGNEVQLRVAAGENWHQCVSWCLSRGYPGLENLALIPGTVGAAPVQNIGAYGVELAEYVVQVDGVQLIDGKSCTLSAQECCFSYRDSVFKQALSNQLLIQSVDLRLPKNRLPRHDYPALNNYLAEKQIQRPAPHEIFAAVIEIRRSKLPDPHDLPNAGSFFKNPAVSALEAEGLKQAWPDMPVFPQVDGSVRVAAAWLIEHCGFKQRQQDPVRVHAEHALVITNPHGRGGSEVAALAAEITDAVQSTFDIDLQQEPRSYGWV